MALKEGQKRVNEAREYLNKYANGKAMPALALKDNKTNVTFLCYVIKMELQRRLYRGCLTRKKLQS